MKFIIFKILVFFSMTTQAETIQSFKILSSNKNLEKISHHYEVKEKLEDGYLIYVLKEKVDEFKKLAPRAKLISSDINKFLKNKANIRGYHNFKEVQEYAKNLKKNFPSLVDIIHYGKSKTGLPLFAIKLSDRVQESEKDEKKIMLTAATHGDELITVEVLMGLTDKLVKNYKTDDRMKAIIDHTEIYIVLVVSPEGFTRRSRYVGRIDPNRQYPWPGHPNRKTPVVAIDHIMKFFKEKNFSGVMDFHASGKMIMFPWGFTKGSIGAGDYQIFDQLTTDMSKINQYKHGQISKIIYVAKGSSADFYYSHNNALALGIELTTSKVPRRSKIPSIIDEASEMTWKFLEHFSL